MSRTLDQLQLLAPVLTRYTASEFLLPTHRHLPIDDLSVVILRLGINSQNTHDFLHRCVWLTLWSISKTVLCIVE